MHLAAWHAMRFRLLARPGRVGLVTHVRPVIFDPQAPRPPIHMVRVGKLQLKPALLGFNSARRTDTKKNHPRP
jgi:hypothetical protein